MVEVLKTNVLSRAQAKLVTTQIETRFQSYQATFDLEDCDRVLRVASGETVVCGDSLVQLLAELGYTAEILKDDFAYFPELTSAGSPPLSVR